MSTLALARSLFALTAGTHFLFVALTLGLATIVAIVQTRAVFGGGDAHLRMVRFWGQLYVINYAVGIVTGLLMEFQFGLAWPGLADRAPGVFGAPLALETLVAFFVEATFLGLWIFGWDRLNRHAHLALIWIVTLTAYASAYFVLVANGFLNHPVGYVRIGGALRVDSTAALFTNPAALLPLAHVVSGAFLTAGFFMAGVSAWHLLRGHEPDLYRRSLRIGLSAAALAVLPTAAFGGVQFPYAHNDGGVRPLTGLSANLMMAAWAWMAVVALVALVKLPFRAWLLRGRIFLRVLPATLPLPYVAMLAGWIYRETGRQPWMIYGVLRTEDAVRPIGHGAMLAASTGVTVLFAALVLVNVTLLRRYARLGPDGAALGHAELPARPEPVPSF
ncbi:cytochrome ubiquinol oxidase subunit I [Actinoallomurus spadix]|uniref:Cytochrome ubiquinol oxidase subunit I n=1 Tax=Actinoallomurus spadix TaxID=79912 RepID=A0ABN0WSY3_9ACTN|nr:cytochrome ubiquinol oxidase subunit I [Actinoallomurus spadix]MCO5990178.1 cytochrome ubiquinol oxidase subunit I [Actinoallomurus spadix]